MNKYASMLTAICLAVCLLFFACENPAAEGDTSATHVEPATGTASDHANDPEPETESPRPTLMERRRAVFRYVSFLRRCQKCLFPCRQSGSSSLLASRSARLPSTSLALPSAAIWPFESRITRSQVSRIMSRS